MLLSLLSVPIGYITWWSGFIAGIPAGWTLCDGTEGTPDLRDKFVIGAAGTFIPGATGGTAAHVHDFTGDGHYHVLTEPGPIDFGFDDRERTTTEPIVGTTDQRAMRPPWYALAYVMYIGP